MEILALIVGSFIVRVVLQISGQRWSTTFTQTATLFLLPIATFVITKTIAGNVALSLGMVGALSIIRFRNPVKSALELSVYFILVAFGISMSVSPKYGYLLILVSASIILGLYLADILIRKFRGYGLYQMSFSEGERLSTLRIIFKDRPDQVTAQIHKDSLISEIYSEGKYEFIYANKSYEKLMNIQSNLIESGEPISYVITKS